jgi:Kef-type K+ transport system membrane component KefB
MPATYCPFAQIRIELWHNPRSSCIVGALRGRCFNGTVQANRNQIPGTAASVHTRLAKHAGRALEFFKRSHARRRVRFSTHSIVDYSPCGSTHSDGGDQHANLLSCHRRVAPLAEVCKGEATTMKSAFSFFPGWPLVPDAIFWAGLALLAAGLCGELCYRAWRLPRISGYAVIGLIAGPAGFGVIDASTAGTSRLLLEVALGLLLFELGSRLDLRWIRRNPWLIASSLAEATLTFAFVFGTLMFLHVPVMVATVLAAIAMATSPAMVIQLKTELRAEGQVTQRLLTLTALNSMYAVVIEKLASSWLHQEIYGNVLATILQPLYLLAGSLILAYALARACHFYYRRVNMQDEHSFVALFGLVLLAIAIAQLFKLSTILSLLAAGIIVKNLEAKPQLWPQHFGTAGWLLTVILFVLTLTSFEWKHIALGGLAALGLIVARLVAKLVGVLAFAKPSGLDWKQGVALGLSLSPMSALAYLLVGDTYELYPGFDPMLRAVVMCSIVVLQIVGPWLVYRCLSLVGERRE